MFTESRQRTYILKQKLWGITRPTRRTHWAKFSGKWCHSQFKLNTILSMSCPPYWQIFYFHFRIWLKEKFKQNGGTWSKKEAFMSINEVPTGDNSVNNWMISIIIYQVIVVSNYPYIQQSSSKGHHRKVIDMTRRAIHHIWWMNNITLTSYSGRWRLKPPAYRLFIQLGGTGFVMGIHRWPVDSPHKEPMTRKKLPFHDVIMMGTKTQWCHTNVPNNVDSGQVTNSNYVSLHIVENVLP